MRLFVRTLQATVEVEVKATDRIAAVRTAALAKLGLSPDTPCRLSWGGRGLDPAHTVSDHSLDADATIKLALQPAAAAGAGGAPPPGGTLPLRAYLCAALRCDSRGLPALQQLARTEDSKVGDKARVMLHLHELLSSERAEDHASPLLTGVFEGGGGQEELTWWQGRWAECLRATAAAVAAASAEEEAAMRLEGSWHGSDQVYDRLVALAGLLLDLPKVQQHEYSLQGRWGRPGQAGGSPAAGAGGAGAGDDIIVVSGGGEGGGEGEEEGDIVVISGAVFWACIVCTAHNPSAASACSTCACYIGDAYNGKNFFSSAMLGTPSQLYPWLYVGAHTSAVGPWLSTPFFTHIVCVVQLQGRHPAEALGPTCFAYLPVGGESGGTLEPSHYAACDSLLEKAFAVMDHARSHGGKCLVHCEHGISRSAAVVGAYLIKRGLAASSDAALAFMRSKRPVKPARNFVAALKAYAAREAGGGTCAIA